MFFLTLENICFQKLVDQLYDFVTFYLSLVNIQIVYSEPGRICSIAS